MKRLYREPLRNPPGSRFVYSDIGFIALGEVVHRVSGQNTRRVCATEYFSARSEWITPHLSPRQSCFPG
jgi:CubicO group peptidase (beta-lactamase class C family)